ncbi:hypothetical protein ACTXT7_012341 [Hymenolepis weldensis]
MVIDKVKLHCYRSLTLMVELSGHEANGRLLQPFCALMKLYLDPATYTVNKVFIKAIHENPSKWNMRPLKSVTKI